MIFHNETPPPEAPPTFEENGEPDSRLCSSVQLRHLPAGFSIRGYLRYDAVATAEVTYVSDDDFNFDPDDAAFLLKRLFGYWTDFDSDGLSVDASLRRLVGHAFTADDNDPAFGGLFIRHLSHSINHGPPRSESA